LHIREVDAIVQVVRAFSDGNVIHTLNRVDPKEDADIINLELVLADLQTVKKRLENAKKNAKGKASADVKTELETLEKVYGCLQVGKFASSQEYGEEEMVVVKELCLLTMKPVLYVVNVDEVRKSESPKVHKVSDSEQIEISCKLEAELAELSQNEAREYLKQLGMNETGLDKLITAGYKLLNLATFLTSGEPETRAWTVKRGTKAPEAAGVIHTDFIKGFVKADVCYWEDFVKYGGWAGIKESGKLRLEGKDYVVQDGDTIYFHISA
jgi:GTP-binding protein YchF